MEDAIICPACGFDPYDMIIYAAKQEFPDRNPRDVIEEMSDEEYKEEADFYVFENHPEYCPNQELLMRHIQMMSEEEAYAYAYNDGHSGSRKNEPYKPNPTTKEGANFKKIYKQRAESADKKFCSNCSQEEEEDGYEISNCTDCYDDFCENCFCSDCETCDDDCLCKCVECGVKGSYMYNLADGGNVCDDCSRRCDECEKRFPRDEVEGNNINHKDYCEDCRNEKGNCEICDDLLIYYYNDAGNCEVCDVSVCIECSSETEDPEKPGHVGHDVACDECVREKKLVVTAETFEADWTDLSRDSSGRWMKQDTQVSGYDSLVKIALKNAGYGEIYENQVTHLEMEYTGANPHAGNKFYFVCITKNNNKMYAVGAYGNMSNRPGAKPNLSRIKLYNLLDNESTGKTDSFGHLSMTAQMSTLVSYARRKITQKLRKGYFAISDGIAGAQYRPEISDENLDAYIDIQPGQSGTFPLPVEKEEPSLNTTNDYITIRDLASMMNKMTGGMLGFAESRNTVLEMLGDNDSMERRDSLYFTIEDTIMTMENYNETGYEGDIQVMVDIMRDTGIAPPANFEEKVMARYQFEDKYAAEDKKILKPEVPADYNIQQTFGNNMILTAEGLEEDRNSPAFEKWEEKFYLCYHDWQDDELHVDTFDEKYQITAYCSLCDATMLLTNLHIGDNGPDVFELPGRRPLLDFYDTSQEAYAAEEEMIKVSATLLREFWEDICNGDESINEVDWEIERAPEAVLMSEEDEGPTIDNFFRELSKLLKKYGSIETFDSERVKEGLYFSGMLLPHNGADNFFHYDEDFGSGIIE